ncbi:probable phytanoyl-CoA dioxygenase [Ptychodera flava]|uniref:probable phytanoyl-CoA dioxygenase n=1 Tax=Ptychodera flava TaxID=63121 RepID=UPI003969D2AC
MVTEDIIREYEENGAVCLRGVFNNYWVDMARKGIEKTLANPSQYSENLKGPTGPGRYFNDYCNWKKIEELEKFVFESPAAEIVGKLMKSKEVAFYHEHVLTKEPGTMKETPWHQDQPYYPVDGDKVCSIWLPIDPVSMETTIQFVKGSHQTGKWFHPRKFATANKYEVINNEEQRIYHTIPDITKETSKDDILKWEVQPGDCIVFHMLSIHGAPGNTSLTVPRRVLSTRWLGDDAVLATRPWEVSPPITGGLKPGQRMLCDTFPLVWRAP